AVLCSQIRQQATPSNPARSPFVSTFHCRTYPTTCSRFRPFVPPTSRKKSYQFTSFQQSLQQYLTNVSKPAAPQSRATTSHAQTHNLQFSINPNYPSVKRFAQSETHPALASNYRYAARAVPNPPRQPPTYASPQCTVRSAHLTNSIPTQHHSDIASH